MYEITQGDCLKLLPTLKTGSIDLIVTDPAYSTISGGNTTKTHATGGILVKNDGKIFKHNNINISDYLPEFYRVLKTNAQCYVMINNLNLRELLNEADKVGFKLHNILIWDKGNVTPNRWGMKCCERICLFYKGAAFSFNDCGTKQLISITNLKNKLHPTEKPVELMKIFISNSSQPGQVVLDPMMGCGSTGVAALELDRKFVGFELDPQYFKAASDRLGL